MIDDKQYNVLIKKYKDGEYEFDYLAKGGRAIIRLDFFYVFFESEKLFFELFPEEMPFNTSFFLVDLECYYAGSIKNYEKTVVSSRSLRLANYATGAVSSFPSSKKKVLISI